MSDEIAVFDIDGTLADVSEPLHHIRTKPKNWNVFFAAISQDKAMWRAHGFVCLQCAPGEF